MYTLFFKTTKLANEFALSNNKAGLIRGDLNSWTYEDDHSFHLATSEDEKNWFIANIWMKRQMLLVSRKANQLTFVRASN